MEDIFDELESDLNQWKQLDKEEAALLQKCTTIATSEMMVPSFSEEILHSLTTMGDTDLMWYYPQAALDSILSLLAVSTTEPTMQALALWKKVLAEAMSTCNQSNGSLPLYETICKLLITTRPAELVPFVKHMHTIQANLITESTTNLYQRAILCFSSISVQDLTIDAIKSYAKLLLLSKQPTCTIRSLHLLASRNLWKQALDLLKFCSSDDGSDLHLFHLLQSYLHQAGQLPTYCLQLLQVAPKSLNTNELVRLLELASDVHNDPAGAGNNVKISGLPAAHVPVFVCANDMESLSVASCRPFLLASLSHGKETRP